MSKKYSALDELLASDTHARSFFGKLPEYVKEQIRSRADSVNSFESLADYADNLTRGDG